MHLESFFAETGNTNTLINTILITNLINSNLYPSQSIIELYFRRWKIEEQYRVEKTYLDIESFHSQSVNGIKQALLAVIVRRQPWMNL